MEPTRSDPLFGRRTFSRRGFLGALGATAATLAVVDPGMLKASVAESWAASLEAASGTINVLTLGDGIFGQPFVSLTPTFEKAFPNITVHNITTGSDAETTKTFAAFAAHSGNYDVIQMDYIYLKGFASAGHLEPLDKYLGSSYLKSFKADVPSSFFDMYSYNGELFGLPTIANSQNFMYNAAILQAAGVPVPDTWNDVLTAGQKVNAHGHGAYGVALDLGRMVKAFSVWSQIFWANGGQIFDDKWVPQVNTLTGVEALDFLTLLTKAGPPGAASYDETAEVKAMANGLAALAPSIWIPDPIVNPGTPAIGKQLHDRIDPKGTVRRAPGMGGLGLGVSAYSQNKAAAAQYVAWFNSASVQQSLIVPNGGQPCRNSAWKINMNAKPWFPALYQDLQVAVVRPQIAQFNQLDSIMGLAMSRTLAGEITAKAALDKAQSQVYAMMKQAGYYK